MLGDETKLNIKERYELFLKLTQEAGLGFTRYWMEDKKGVRSDTRIQRLLNGVD